MFSVGQLFNRFFFSSTFWAMDKRQKNSSWIYHWLWYYLFVQYLTCDTYKSVDDLAMALRPSNILLNAFSSCLLLVYLSLLIFNIVFTEHETVLSANKYIGKKVATFHRSFRHNISPHWTAMTYLFMHKAFNRKSLSCWR